HAEEVAVHRLAHDVRQNRTGRTNQRTRHDQQIVAEHETGGRSSPAGIAVEHRYHDRHIGTTNCHHHMYTEQKGDDGHDDQRCHAAGNVWRIHELTTKPDHEQQTNQVDTVTCRQEQRFAADFAVQFAERDQGTRERYRTDEDTDVDF